MAAPDGTTFAREVIRHPGAVAMVAETGDGVALIRQYRAPVDEALLELPAGKLDVPGEDPAVAAARELEEEVGLRPGALELLATFYTGPGFTDEHMAIYLATGCEDAPIRPHGPEEEAAEIVHVPAGDLMDLISGGQIADAKTLVGLLLYLQRR